MIDRHYGHLARDSHVHAVSLLDALAAERAVDTTWTSNRSRAIALSNSDSKASSETNQPARGRSVDAEACSCRPCRQRKELISRHFAKPSDGLEPSTPSLPSWVANGCGSACLSGFRGCSICPRLPPVAPAGLHKYSTIVCSARRCLALRLDGITVLLYNT
jgi:hypothetical protein